MCLQLQRAQQGILELVKGVKGRGKGGLAPEQLEELEALVDSLEANGGIKVRLALQGRAQGGALRDLQRCCEGVAVHSSFAAPGWEYGMGEAGACAYSGGGKGLEGPAGHPELPGVSQCACAYGVLQHPGEGALAFAYSGGGCKCGPLGTHSYSSPKA